MPPLDPFYFCALTCFFAYELIRLGLLLICYSSLPGTRFLPQISTATTDISSTTFYDLSQRCQARVASSSTANLGLSFQNYNKVPTDSLEERNYQIPSEHITKYLSRSFFNGNWDT